MIDRYKITGVLGSGGSGVTYRAFDMRSGRDVAIKEYFPKAWSVRSPEGRVLVAAPRFEADFRWGLDRFISEAEVLGKLSNACIVAIERVFAAMGTGYMQLEFIRGPSLERWATASRPRPLQFALDPFAEGLTNALKQIHRLGFLHCDLSPRNILLTERGLPVLIDFGSARRLDGTHSVAPNLLVTPHYAAQEQYVSSGAQLGPWTDIYSAAALLYFLIKGRPPAAAPSRAIKGPEDDVGLRTKEIGDGYRPSFLDAIEWGLALFPADRPLDVEAWRRMLLWEGAGSAEIDIRRPGLAMSRS